MGAPTRLPVVRGLLALVVAVAAATAGSALEAAKTDVTVDYDMKFTFAGLRTWRWHPDGTGDVKLAMSRDDNPAQVAATVDPIIVPAVEREMTANGLVRGDGETDYFLHYYALVTMGESRQVQGQFLPAVANWGVPPVLLGNTTSLEIYPVGTLVLDVTAVSTKQVVWRGVARRKLDVDRAGAARRTEIERAVRELLKKFPPKPRKK
jgi:hypothetical protein